ncbi:hypothetical protein D3C73_1391450 [compost metagenome]
MSEQCLEPGLLVVRGDAGQTADLQAAQQKVDLRLRKSCERTPELAQGVSVEARQCSRIEHPPGRRLPVDVRRAPQQPANEVGRANLTCRRNPAPYVTR